MISQLCPGGILSSTGSGTKLTLYCGLFAFSNSSSINSLTAGYGFRLQPGTYKVTCGPVIGQYLPKLKPLMKATPCEKIIPLKSLIKF